MTSFILITLLVVLLFDVVLTVGVDIVTVVFGEVLVVAFKKSELLTNFGLPSYFFADCFLATAFFVGAFLTDAFLATAFLATTFFAVAFFLAWLEACFFSGLVFFDVMPRTLVGTIER